MPIRVSVIVPHLNQPELLRLLLVSLEAQTTGMDDTEVIVVDNGSRALPRDVIDEFPFARLVTEATPGPGPARNRGVAEAKGGLLAFTDADCQVASDWLAVIRGRFGADPDLSALGGEIRMTMRDPRRPTPAEAYECIYAYNQRDYMKRLGFSVTANLAMRRAVFDAVGPFAGIEVAEDMDWGARALAIGHRTVFAPDMVIHHPARHSMRDLCAKWDRNISHHYRVRANGMSGRAKWTATALALIASPPAAIPQILRSKRVSSPRARIQAFIGLTRLRAYRGRRMLAIMLTPDALDGTQQWNRE